MSPPTIVSHNGRSRSPSLTREVRAAPDGALSCTIGREWSSTLFYALRGGLCSALGCSSHSQYALIASSVRFSYLSCFGERSRWRVLNCRGWQWSSGLKHQHTFGVGCGLNPSFLRCARTRVFQLCDTAWKGNSTSCRRANGRFPTQMARNRRFRRTSFDPQADLI